MKHFAAAYTLPAFEGCTRKQRFHQHRIHQGDVQGENIADVEKQFIKLHPGRKILIRYIEEIEQPSEIRKFRPACLEINKHLWWEISSTLVAIEEVVKPADG